MHAGWQQEYLALVLPANFILDPFKGIGDDFRFGAKI